MKLIVSIKGSKGMKTNNHFIKLEENETFADFKQEYFNRVAPGIIRSAKSMIKARSGNKQILEYLTSKNVLLEILIGDATVLKDQIKEVDKKFKTALSTKRKRDLIGRVFGYQNRFQKKPCHGKWLAERLKIRSCPYCNAQYTLFVKHRKENGADVRKKRFQFDHFYSQADYPYLSVSLYNLIPSCASCNHAKLDKPFDITSHFHPYDDENDLDLWATFDVQVKFDEAGRPDRGVGKFKSDRIDACQALGLMEEHLEVKFEPRYPGTPKDRIVSDHNDTFFIDGIYERHKDRALEVVKNSVVYATSMQHHLVEIEGLFAKDRSFILRFILGAHGLKEEIPLRPLNKLVRDTAIQYGLIDEFGELIAVGEANT